MAETKTQTLDDDLVGTLKAPEGKKEIIVWDDMVPRFGVRVSRSGMRSWIVRYRGMRPGGKIGSRQLVIGGHGEMPIEDARRKAREVLEKAESEGEAHGRPEEPAAGPSPAPPPNDAVVEAEPGVEAETTAEAELSADEEYDLEPGEELDPETGEVFSTASEAGEAESHDDGLDLEDIGRTSGPGPEAEADGEGQGADPSPYVTEIVDDTIGRVGGGAGQDGVEPDPYAADTPARPVGHAEEPPADRRGGDGDGVSLQARRKGGDVAGEREPEIPEHGGQQEPAASAGAEEARAERPKLPGFVDGAKATVRTAGKAVGGVVGMVRKGGAGDTVAGGTEEAAGEAEAAGEPPPQSPRPAEAPAAEERANREDVAEAAKQAKQKTEDAEAVGEKTRDGREFSDATLAGLAENLGHVRGEIDRISAANREFGPRLDNLATAISVSTRDFRQRRRRRVRAALAMATMLALGTAGGAVLQSQEPFLPRADPTLGWKDHVWEYYGEAVMGCFQRAKKTESGYADCSLKVRGR